VKNTGMILKIFSPKNLAKKLAILTKNKAIFLIDHWFLKKNAIFSPKIGKNCRKL
jgi:hypothetical protein